MKKFLDDAKSMKNELIEWRRHIHQDPEIGMELPHTTEYVVNELTKMGYRPEIICQSGIVAVLEGDNSGKTLLLRADMDALPMPELNDLPYKSKNECKAHACGHDTHTSMLLGAAKLLISNKDKIHGNVKFMFQPGEEGYNGAQHMINAGLLENPKVDAAMAYHCLCGDPYKTGFMLCALDGPAKASADTFAINVYGKGTHGARPEHGIDVVNIMCHIQNALQTINAREIKSIEPKVLTICQINVGSAANILPDSGVMKGTIRTFNEDIRQQIKKRVIEIAQGIAETFGGRAEVIYENGLGSTINDVKIAAEMFSYVQELIGKENTGVIEPIMGAEDFSEVMCRVPGVYMDLSFGSPEEGYFYKVHTPQVTFNEDALPVGAACFAHCSVRWLENNK